jgi:hypothetical protein
LQARIGLQAGNWLAHDKNAVFEGNLRVAQGGAVRGMQVCGVHALCRDSARVLNECNNCSGFYVIQIGFHPLLMRRQADADSAIEERLYTSSRGSVLIGFEYVEILLANIDAPVEDRLENLR